MWSKSTDKDGPAWRTAAPPYFPALDGLRVFASAMVLLHHCAGSRQTGWLPMRLLTLQSGNGFGVGLFLILSGMLLTGIVIRSRHDTHRYRTFLTRRTVRIFPLYFLYLAIALAATLLARRTPLHHLWIYLLFLQDLVLHGAAGARSVMPVDHLWTMAVQEQFYLLWPLLVWRCRSLRQVRWLCVGGVALSLLARIVVAHQGGTGDLLVRLPVCRMGELCLGGLLAVEVCEPTWIIRLLPRFLLPLTGIYFVWEWFGLDYGTPMGSIVGLQLMAVGCAALIVRAMDPASLVSRALGGKAIAAAGKKYSFGIYMFHPFMLSLGTFQLHIGAFGRPLMAVVSFGVAWLSYHFYEKRFLGPSGGTRRATDRRQPEREAQGLSDGVGVMALADPVAGI